MINRNTRHTLLASLAATSTLLSPSLAFGGSPPDLVPVALVAPEQVHVGTEVVVHFSTGNLGGDFNGEYTAEIVLSDDAVIDQDDLVAASMTTAFLGQHSTMATIPSDTAWGTYHWGLRILPVDGEAKTSNNALLGLATSVIEVTLAVADPSPITVFHRPTDEDIAVPEVIVENVGTPGDILVYQASALTAAPWLSFDPPENFAVAGEEPTPNRLVIDPHGLPLGVYETTVRFQNLASQDNFEDVSLTLIIGDPKFETGDRVQGQINFEGEVDEIVFDGLKGMKVPFEVKTSGGDLAPRLTLIAPSGAEEAKLKFKSSSNYVKKSVKLKESGEYRLLISGKGDSIGDYKIRTSRKMPKKAKSYSKVIESNESMTILILAGATLDLAAMPKDGFGGSMALSLTMPDGATYDMNSHLSQEPNGEVKATGMEMTLSGAYEVRWSGGDGEVKVHSSPVQPKLGKSKIYLD